MAKYCRCRVVVANKSSVVKTQIRFLKHYRVKEPLILASERPRTQVKTYDGSDDFFRFQGGRFLWDDHNQTTKRYMKFNVEELARVATQAVNKDGYHRRRRCVMIQKLHDGLNSKIVLFTMDDDTKVVGKVPYSFAGIPHYTTASEVATMAFVSALSISLPICFGCVLTRDLDAGCYENTCPSSSCL